jgi:hypothetical protein
MYYNNNYKNVYSGMPWYWQVVQQCTPLANSGLDENTSCSWGYANHAQRQTQFSETTNQPGDQSFYLDVAYYMRKTLRFRVPTVQPQDVSFKISLCNIS